MQTLKYRFDEIKHGRLTHGSNEDIVIMIIELIITQVPPGILWPTWCPHIHRDFQRKYIWQSLQNWNFPNTFLIKG